MFSFLSTLIGSLKSALHPHSPPPSPSQTQSQDQDQDQDQSIQQDGLESSEQVPVSSSPVEPIIPVQVTEGVQHVESKAPEETPPPSSSAIELRLFCLLIITEAQAEVDSSKKAPSDIKFKIETLCEPKRSLEQLRAEISKIYSPTSTHKKEPSSRSSSEAIRSVRSHSAPGWREKAFARYSSFLRRACKWTAIQEQKAELKGAEGRLNILRDVGSQLLQELEKGPSRSNAKVANLRELMESIKALKLEKLKALAQSVRHDDKIDLPAGRRLKSRQGEIYLTTISPRVKGGLDKKPDPIVVESLINYFTAFQEKLDRTASASTGANDDLESKDRYGLSFTSSSSDGSSPATIPSGHGAAAAASSSSLGSSSSLPDLEASFDSSNTSSDSNSNFSSTSPADDQSSIERPISVNSSTPVDALSRVADWMATQLGLLSPSGPFNKDLHSFPCNQKKDDGKFATVDEELVVVGDEGLNSRESRKVEEKSVKLGGKESEALRSSLISTFIQDGGNTTVEDGASSINVEAPQVVSSSRLDPSVNSSKVVKPNAFSSEKSAPTSKSPNDCLFTALIKEIERLESGSVAQESINRELLEARTPSSMRSLIHTRLLALRNSFGKDWILFKNWFFSLGTNDENVNLLIRQGLFTSGDVDDEAFKKDVDLIGIEGNAVPYYLIPLISFVLGVCLRVRLSFGEIEFPIGPVGTYLGVPIGLEISRDREGKGHAVSADVCTDTTLHEAVFSQVALPTPLGLPRLDSFLRFSQDHHSYPGQLGFPPSLPIGSDDSSEHDQLDPYSEANSQTGSGIDDMDLDQDGTGSESDEMELDQGGTGSGNDEMDFDQDQEPREGDNRAPGVDDTDQDEREQTQAGSSKEQKEKDRENVEPDLDTNILNRNSDEEGEDVKVGNQSVGAAQDAVASASTSNQEPNTSNEEEEEEPVPDFADFDPSDQEPAPPQITIESTLESAAIPEEPNQEAGDDPSETSNAHFSYPLAPAPEPALDLSPVELVEFALRVYQSRYFAAYDQSGSTPEERVRIMLRMALETEAQVDQVMKRRQTQLPTSKPEWDQLSLDKVAKSFYDTSSDFKNSDFDPALNLNGFWVYLRSVAVRLDFIIPELEQFIKDEPHAPTKHFAQLLLDAWKEDEKTGRANGATGYVGTTNGPLQLRVDQDIGKCLEPERETWTLMLFFHKLAEAEKPKDNPGIVIIEKAVLEIDPKKCADLGLPVEIPLRGLETVIYDSLLPISLPNQWVRYKEDLLIALVNCMRPNGAPLSGSLGMFLPTDTVFLEHLLSTEIPSPPLSFKPELHLVSQPAHNEDIQAHLPVVIEKKLELILQKTVDIELKVFSPNTALPDSRGHREFNAPEILKRADKKFTLDGQHYYLLIDAEPQFRSMDLFFQDKVNSSRYEVTLSIFAKDVIRKFRPTPGLSFASASPGGLLEYSIKNIDDGVVTKFIVARTYGSGNYRWVDSHEKAARAEIDATYKSFSRLADLFLVWITLMAKGNFSAADYGTEAISTGTAATFDWIQDKRIECVNALPDWKGMHPTATWLRSGPKDKDFLVSFFGHQLGIFVRPTVESRKVEAADHQSPLTFKLRADEVSDQIKLEYTSTSKGKVITVRTWSLRQFIVEYQCGLGLLVSHSVSWWSSRRSPLALSPQKIKELIEFAVDPARRAGNFNKPILVSRASFLAGQLNLYSLHPGVSYELLTQRYRSTEKDDRSTHRFQLSRSHIKGPVVADCEVLVHAEIDRGFLLLRISPPLDDEHKHLEIAFRTGEQIESWKTATSLPYPMIRLRLAIAPLSKGLTASLNYFISTIPSKWQLDSHIKVKNFATVGDQTLMDSALTEATFETLGETLADKDKYVKNRAINLLGFFAGDKIIKISQDNPSSEMESLEKELTSSQIENDQQPSDQV